jgi:hypothetical protein
MVKTTSGGNPFGSSITYPYLSSSLQGIIFPQRIRFGGDGSDGAYTAPAGTTNISGIKQYTSLSVPVGATLNLTDNTHIFCQGDVSIAGSITRSTFATPYFAVQNGESGSVGSRPMGGRTGSSIYKYQFFRGAIGGGAGGFAGTSVIVAALSGSGGGGGAGYSFGGFGGMGEHSTSFFAGSSSGGFGGCGLYIECIGNLTISGTITISGTNGNGASSSDMGGGGGGGGGTMICYALGNANLTGTLNSIGGNGGNASTGRGGGGGGGGGGYFHIGYQGTLVANSLTINVTGGSAGSGGGAGGNSGVAGANGSSDIYQLKAY